ncbi:MAG: membrane protein insertase YidC [Candidatus Marinimicrobia bacterium]|jgi:YidC/Oxa1 family membrane protein insertase|nr:membrane protein insertase YidC [Candidatus Neomarinimicrobiota bacterium]
MNKNTVLAFLLIALILIMMPEYFKMIGLANESPPTNDQTNKVPVDGPKSERDNNFKPLGSDEQQTSFSTDEDDPPTSSITLKDTIQEVVLTIETNLYTALVSSKGGGTLQSYEVNNYDHWEGGKVDLIDTTLNAGNPMLVIGTGNGLDTLTTTFKLEEGGYYDNKTVKINEATTLTFHLGERPGVVSTTKTLTFYPDSYRIGVDVDVVSRAGAPKIYLLWSGGLPVTEKDTSDDTYYIEAGLLQGGELFSISGSDGEKAGNNSETLWAAVRTKYFTSALISAPQHQHTSASSGLIKSKKIKSKKDGGTGGTPQHSAQLGFDGGRAELGLYLGPLEYDRIADLDVDLEQTMNLGWAPIRPIGKGILWILTNLYEIIPNYGVLLIVFSILVKVVLHPLTRKSYKSTKEMQAIQPLVADLKNKYKGDSQKLNQETMKLYKEHGVSPLGGCLPMLLQMPILIALFTVFRSTIVFRGAPFMLWITDLSQPDQLFNLPFTIPLLGWSTFNVLPILMGATMLYQQKTMSVQSPSQQKSFMYIMNGFFLIIFYTFPSGLNLYYTCFNVLTILQQKYMVHPSSPPPVKSN